MLDSLVAAAAVLALFGATVWALRRAPRAWPGPRSGGAPLRERERLALGPQHRLHWIEAGGEQWLIATHPGGVTAVTRLDASPADAGGGGRRGAAA